MNCFAKSSAEGSESVYMFEIVNKLYLCHLLRQGDTKEPLLCQNVGLDDTQAKFKYGQARIQPYARASTYFS